MRTTTDGDFLFGPDWDALAKDAFENGISILSGCSPSKGTGDSVDVAGGTASVNGSEVNVSSQNVGLASRSSFDRYDLITIDSGGTVADVTGSSELTTPSIPTDEVLVAIVKVPSDSGVAITVLDARIVTSDLFIDTLLVRSLDAGDLVAASVTAQEEFRPPKKTSDPASPNNGEVWYREDID